MNYIDYKTYKELKTYVKTGKPFSSSIPEWDTFADNQFIEDIPEHQRNKNEYKHKTNEKAKRFVGDHKRKSFVQAITLILIIMTVIISLISLLKP